MLKMGKETLLSTEKRAQIVTLSNSNFSVSQIAKKVKVSKTAMHNAIMKYQNEGTFKDRKGLADQEFPAAEMTVSCIR